MEIIRFVDRNDSYNIIESTPDFRVRIHKSFVYWVTYAFIAATLAILIIMHTVFKDLIDYGNSSLLPLSDVIIGVFLLIFVLLVFQVYVFVMMSRLHQIANASEFQSMMFANAMKVHSLFALIVTRDHNVVYSDNRSMDIFAEERIYDLKELLDHPGLKPPNRDIILTAIENGESTEVPFIYRDSKGNAYDAMIVIDPISRPAGFFIIRGY